jgi:hypothetical protein
MRYPSQTCVRLSPQRRNSLTATRVRNRQTIALQEIAAAEGAFDDAGVDGYLQRPPAPVTPENEYRR